MNSLNETLAADPAQSTVVPIDDELAGQAGLGRAERTERTERTDETAGH